MSCVLRAFGKDFDVDAYLRGSTFSPCRVFRNYESISATVGFNIAVSNADLEDFAGQVIDSIAFLEQNQEEIERLKAFPGVEDLCLDYAVGVSPDCLSKSLRFTAQILERASRCGVEIEISVYKTDI